MDRKFSLDKGALAADKIKQPFQLLAAWLVAMIATSSAFLTAAANIQTPTWIPGALAIAAILNVPMFTWFLYRMQTKFRVQMQDDSYFSEHMKMTLENETGSLNQLTGSLNKLMNAAGLGVDGLIEGKSISDLRPDQKAEILAEMKNFEDPILNLEALNPLQTHVDPNVLLEYGKALMANREWKRAAVYLDDYALRKPADWNGHFLRGVAHANTDDGPETDHAALAAYTNAILAAPEDIEQNRMARFLSYRAAMLKRLGKFIEALEDLNKAEKLASHYYEANDIRYNRACIYAMQGKKDELLNVIKKLEISPPDLARIRKHENDYFKDFKNDPEFQNLLRSCQDSSEIK